MTHQLSLGASVKLRIINLETSKTELVPVIRLVDKVSYVYDFYGNPKRIHVTAGNSEKKYLVGAASGETLQFGDGTMLYMRTHGVAGFKRALLSELSAPAYVRLPQKKISQPTGVADMLDYEEKSGMFLSPPDVAEMIRALEVVGSLGILVQRDLTTLKIALDKNRPSCFAAKVLNGNFTLDITSTMTDLASRGIIQPWKMFGPEVIDDTEKTGVIFEGNCIFNDVPLTNVRVMNKPGIMFNVEVEEPDIPVECQWFCM